MGLSRSGRETRRRREKVQALSGSHCRQTWRQVVRVSKSLRTRGEKERSKEDGEDGVAGEIVQEQTGVVGVECWI